MSFSVTWHRFLQAPQLHWKDATAFFCRHFHPLYLLVGALRQTTTFQQSGARTSALRFGLQVGVICSFSCCSFDLTPRGGYEMIYDRVQLEPNKMWSQENSYYHSPAGSEPVQLISVIRMTIFWHWWRKQGALQTGNVYQITTTSQVCTHTHNMQIKLNMETVNISLWYLYFLLT